jgi:hypothetical protein
LVEDWSYFGLGDNFNLKRRVLLDFGMHQSQFVADQVIIDSKK